MLDKQTSILLANLNSICQDGSYKVIDKKDLINSNSKKYKLDEDSLKAMIDHLKERDYLSIKYSDDKVYCLSVLPKGRLFDEKSKELAKEKRKYNKLIIVTLSLSSIASFVGAFCAMLVFKLLF